MSNIADKRINAYINTFGISHAHTGYTYLMYAIRLLVDEQIARGNMTDLYKAVAEKFETKAGYVEHCMRTCIRKAGCTMTNKEFVVTAMDELVFGFGED